MENFDEFKTKLLSIPKKSLTNTKRTLEDKSITRILEEIVKYCLNKIDEFIQKFNIVNKNCDELKNINYKYNVEKTRLRKLQTAEYNRKKFYTPTNKSTRKYIWDTYESKDFICQENEEKREEQTETDENLKKKYSSKSSEKTAKEQNLEGLEEDISKNNVELIHTQKEKNTINELMKENSYE